MLKCGGKSESVLGDLLEEFLEFFKSENGIRKMEMSFNSVPNYKFVRFLDFEINGCKRAPISVLVGGGAEVTNFVVLASVPMLKCGQKVSSKPRGKSPLTGVLLLGAQ